ncbi:tumor necrosis factor receptor superfamily member 9 [Tenrec ecaudatus]|uniref:tumor necrosis factor receptor superfamily member 9 n=1 Tax=Tenrec ecaudatus TaxID=94439 RepID=UPI003F59182F
MRDSIMGNSCYSMVATVLLVLNLERTGAAPDSCGDCPAGTLCENNRKPACIPCPLNSFSSTGGQMSCDVCKQCKGVFRTKRACSPTSDAECECVSGFHCLGAGCTQCQRDCKPGQGVTKRGCKDCCFGTYNDQTEGVCRPWTNCSSHGKAVLVNGTREKDVVCGPRLVDFSPTTSSATVPAPERKADGQPRVKGVFLALMLAVVLSLMFVFLLHFARANWGRKKLLYIFKQPFIKPVQTAQEEDACSCRFPEEEEGAREP